MIACKVLHIARTGSQRYAGCSAMTNIQAPDALEAAMKYRNPQRRHHAMASITENDVGLTLNSEDLVEINRAVT